MDNSPVARGQWDAQPSDSRMPAIVTWRPVTSAPKAGKQWPKTALLGVRQHTEALKGQMKRNTSMRLRRGCGENKKQHYHQCHHVSSALAAARTATQESAFTATVDAAKIWKLGVQIDNRAHQHRLFETTLCLYNVVYTVLSLLR